MENIHAGIIDYAILIIYFLFVLGIGWMVRPYVKTRSLPG
jgi:Na+/proline symporter